MDNYPNDMDNYPDDMGNYPDDMGKYPDDMDNYPDDMDNYPGDRWLLSPKPSFFSSFFHPFRFAHEPVLPKGKPTEHCCWICRVVSKMDSSAIIIRVAPIIILNILLPLYY